MIEDGKSSGPPSPNSKFVGLSYNALVFSTDVKDLRSFKFEDTSNGKLLT